MRLSIPEPDGSRRLVQLDPRNPIRLGSHPDAEVALPLEGILPIHCGIGFADGALKIVPSKSLGEIEVNGARVPQAVIRVGDVIRVGPLAIEVVADASPARRVQQEQEQELASLIADPTPPRTADRDASGGADRPAVSAPVAQPQEPPVLLTIMDEEIVELEVALAASIPTGATVRPASWRDPQVGPAAQIVSADQAAALPAPTGPLRESPVSKLWFKLLLAGMILAPLIGLIFFLVLRMPSARDKFQAADRQFRAGAWGDAVRDFGIFLSEHPEHRRAEEARVKRGLARLKLLANDPARPSERPSERLQTIEAVWAEWGEATKYAETEAETAVLVRPVAHQLLVEARDFHAKSARAEAEQSLSRARGAIGFLTTCLGAAATADPDLADLELQSAQLRRLLARDKAIDEHLVKVQQVADAGDLDAAFRAKEALLAEYSDAASNSSLWRSLRSLGQQAAGKVRVEASPTPAESGELPSATRLLATLWSPHQSPLPDSGAVISWVSQEQGAAYACDAGSGRLLWRRAVGFGTDFAPATVGDNGREGVLLVDSRNAQLLRVDSVTGQVKWRQQIAPVAGNPVVAGSLVFAPSADGTFSEISLESGAIQARYMIPELGSADATWDPRSQTIFQPARHSVLYALSATRRRVSGAVYIGHAPDAIPFAPVVAGDHLLVVEHAVADSRLHVIRIGGLTLVQTLPIDQLAAAPPLVTEKFVFLPTEGGALVVIEFDNRNANQPAKVVRSESFVPPSGRSRAEYRLFGSWLLRAGAGLDAYSIAPESELLAGHAASGRALPGFRRFEDDEIAPPVSIQAEHAIVLRRQGRRGGLTLAALRPADLAATWETRIGAVPDSNRVTVARRALAAAETLVATTADGVFRIPLHDPSQDRPGSAIAPSPAQTSERAADQNGTEVFAVAGSRELFELSGSDVEPSVHRIALPGELASGTKISSSRVLIALRGGMVFQLDLTTGKAVGEPFLPTLDPQALPRWLDPFMVEKGRLLLPDARGTLYMLEVQAEPASVKVALQKALDGPISGPLCLAGGTLWVLHKNRELRGYDVATLEPSATLSLDDEVTWGPVAAGDRLLLAVSSGRTLCLDATGKTVWERDFESGPFAGAAVDGERILFASQSGRVWLVSLASGEPSGHSLETGEWLAREPIVVGNQIVLTTADGSLLRLSETMDALAQGSEPGSP